MGAGGAKLVSLPPFMLGPLEVVPGGPAGVYSAIVMTYQKVSNLLLIGKYNRDGEIDVSKRECNGPNTLCNEWEA